MASTINASNGATSGLIQTGDASGVLALQTNNGTTALTIDTSGNVGIGTTSPSTLLTVSGANTAARGQVSVIGASTADPRITLYRGSTLSGGISCTSSQMYLLAAEAVPLAFYTSDTERARIDSSGNFGIGTTSPANPTGGKGFEISNSSGASVRITNATTFLDLQSGSAANYILSNGAFPMVLYTNSAERARIDSSGNLLVGTSSNNGRLCVQGATANSSANALYVTSSSGSQMFLVRNDGALRSESTYYITTASAGNLNIDTSGYIARSTSSLKYKNNVQDATHGLAKVLALRPVTYKGNNNGDTVFGGLIAEEVHEAGLTEFVQYADDGSPDALAYGNMVSLAFKAIQEQQAIIESLKARLDAANL